MFIVWHFSTNHLVAQLQGVYDNEDLAREACGVGDCYHPIELNKTYTEDVEVEDTALYRTKKGEFKNRFDFLRELSVEMENNKEVTDNIRKESDLVEQTK